MTTCSKISPPIVVSLSLLFLVGACGSSTTTPDGGSKKDATADSKGSSDGGVDTATPDGATVTADASTGDAAVDSAPADTAAPDAPRDRAPDAGAPDAATPDAPRDTATPDAAAPDAAMADAEEPQPDAAGPRDVGGNNVALEAEALDHDGHGLGVFDPDDAPSSGGEEIPFPGPAVGNSIDFTFGGVRAGDYQISLDWTGDDDRAIVGLSVDGTRVGDTLDQFTADVERTTTPFGVVTLAAGMHTIALAVTGHNAGARGFNNAADRFILIRQ